MVSTILADAARWMPGTRELANRDLPFVGYRNAEVDRRDILLARLLLTETALLKLGSETP